MSSHCCRTRCGTTRDWPIIPRTRCPQFRIYPLYGKLKVLEMEFDAGDGGPPLALDERLGRLEHGADRIRVPLRFALLPYNLKMHIGLVRARVHAEETRRTAAPSADERR